MADAVAIRQTDRPPSTATIAGREDKDEKGVARKSQTSLKATTTQTTTARVIKEKNAAVTSPPHLKVQASLKSHHVPTKPNPVEHQPQPRRIEDEKKTTTESSYQYYDPEGVMSEDSLVFAELEDPAEDRQDGEEEEEENAVVSIPLAKATPRSISRRSTEVSNYIEMFFIHRIGIRIYLWIRIVS